MKTETTTWSEFLKVRKATAEEKYLHQKKKNPKEQDCESDHLIRSFEITTEFTNLSVPAE